MKKVVIAGGTGFIGKHLQQRFAADGYEVLLISRGTDNINWEDEERILNALHGAEALINLAGKSVDCRYNEKNRRAIFTSRTETTRKLQALIERCDDPPKLWINSSTATIYRHAEDRPMDEYTGEIGSGFSVDVAKAWEGAFFERDTKKTRKVALRIAITIGKGGGVMTPFINLVKFGLGGKQGNGRQMFSWIHITDLFRIMQYIMDKPEMKGIYNCSAPAPVKNAEFMRQLRRIIKPPFFLPSPEILLKFGAFFINTETELILKSRWVVPTRLLEAGFGFRFPTIEAALDDIIKN